ncbi:MAG: TVP38/TMEM64 family protein [Acidaminobacteraceae bacterium]
MKKENKRLFYNALAICFLVLFLLFVAKSQVGSHWLKILNEGSVEDLVLSIKGYGIWAPLISVGLMILQAFIAPIPAFLITGANGVVFGVFWGVVISWIGAMFGAAGTFYLARLLGIDFVKRFEKDGSLVKKVDDISQVHGIKIIFIGRLLPFISFDFLSYAAGLSKIKAKHFFIATAIGMLPGTFAYVLLGSQIIKYSGTVNQMLIIIALLFIILWAISRIKFQIDKRKKHNEK